MPIVNPPFCGGEMLWSEYGDAHGLIMSEGLLNVGMLMD